MRGTLFEIRREQPSTRLARLAALSAVVMALGCGADAADVSPDDGGVGGSGGTGGAQGCDPGMDVSPFQCSEGVSRRYEAGPDNTCRWTTDPCAGETPVCIQSSPGAGFCGACPVGPGPAMVSVGDSCVDATEVTRDDYAAWLSGAPSSTGQVAACASNSDFAADETCMAGAEVCQADCGDHPQVCVDWCDAAAYCAWAGKRLCGGHGTGEREELLQACARGTSESYPYGASPESGWCNDADNDVGTTVPAGSSPDCARMQVNGQIFDTTGNVWEWEAFCSADTGPDDHCRVRGGSYREPSSSNTCSAVDDSRARSAVAANVGFRCCGP